jgi:hypothetical protein
MGARVSAIQLLDIEFLGGQYGTAAPSSSSRVEVTFILRVAAPFADTAPEKAKGPPYDLLRMAH